MKKNFGILSALSGSLLLIAAAGGPDFSRAQKQPSSVDHSSVTWKLPKDAKAEDYIGSDTCAGCHEAQFGQFSKTPHAHLGEEGQYGTGCEGCHGPGKAHAEAQVEAMGDPVKEMAARKLIFSFQEKPGKNAEQCLTCHSTGRNQAHFASSTHKMVGVSCQECHAAHLLKSTEKPARTSPRPAQAQLFGSPQLVEETRWLAESLLLKSQPELCYQCHGTIQMQFSLPTHHRVPEGLMKCTDCHNAHGTMNQPLLRKANWEGCVTCHVEKRGPFVFEHAAVKVEGCTICHSPHGTVTRNLLLRREGRFTCLECHVEPQAGNVPHGRFSFATLGECVRCHVNIHGSNFNPFFLH